MQEKPWFRFPIFFSKNFDHLLDMMSEGCESTREYLFSLEEVYNRIKDAHEIGKYLLRDDGTIFDFKDISFYYKKLLKLESDFAKVIKKSPEDDAKKFQETVIFALDKMNLRGHQLEYLFYDYTNCDLTKLLESISEPLCRARLIQAVNINSAKRGLCDCAVENKYEFKEQPLLTSQQLTWYPNINEFTYKSKKEIELENSKKYSRPNTDGFNLVK